MITDVTVSDVNTSHVQLTLWAATEQSHIWWQLYHGVRLGAVHPLTVGSPSHSAWIRLNYSTFLSAVAPGARDIWIILLPELCLSLTRKVFPLTQDRTGLISTTGAAKTKRTARNIKSCPYREVKMTQNLSVYSASDAKYGNLNYLNPIKWCQEGMNSTHPMVISHPNWNVWMCFPSLPTPWQIHQGKLFILFTPAGYQMHRPWLMGSH